MNDEEWSDWFIHDGKGCPLAKGTIAQCEYDDGQILAPGPVLTQGDGVGRSWDRRFSDSHHQIVAYRIRKPRALRDLIDLVENLPAPTTPIRVDA